MQAGHLGLGWSQGFGNSTQGVELPLSLTIGISDRVEFFASSGGYTAGERLTMGETNMGLKVHLLNFRRIPMGLKMSQKTLELKDTQLNSIIQSQQEQEVALLARYPLLNLQVNNQLGLMKLESDTSGVETTDLLTGLGFSRTLFGQLQVFSEVMLRTSKSHAPMYQSSLGFRSFLLGNLQLEVSGLWLEDEQGRHQVLSLGITATTQKLKSFRVPPSPLMGRATQYVLSIMGFNNERPADSDILPEFYVSWQDRNLPKPPGIEQFTGEILEVRPEFYHDESTYLPAPPQLDPIRSASKKD
jgi:hypothetical protein